VGTCNNGICETGACKPGFEDCNKNLADGCEAELGTDISNCGGCGKSCDPFANANPACESGVCSLGSCKPGFANCNQLPADGCEVSVLSSDANCGSCGMVCSLYKANNVCKSGVCAIASCVGGYENCNAKTADGCEASLQDDPDNCGTCANACIFPNATGVCKLGVCVPEGCTDPYADCNSSPVDGCETNKHTDVNHCGACAFKCQLANAAAVCAMGKCVVEACNTGFADCNNDPADGCEVNLQTDTGNCGTCKKVCNANNGQASCALGACAIGCMIGYDNCDGSLDNGCETNLALNVDHCGACQTKCEAPDGVPNCTNGKCGVSNCLVPFADCNAVASDGCEVNTAANVNHCGGCGKACYASNGTPQCTGGVCNVVSCNPGWADCNAAYGDGCEAALDTLYNCGQCGKDCILPNAKSSCSTQTCQIASCITPYADCDNVLTNGCEVDTNTNVSHCGACGNACSSANGQPLCQGGSCSIVCAADWGNCNASPTDGCETALTNNVKHCGACGLECAVTNGQPTCNGKVCAILSCSAPFADCDLQYGTGCETNTNSNVNHCGGCGQACNANNGTPGCVAGGCVIGCFAGYGNCDGNPDNGCETNLKNDAQNCNACGAACNFPNAIGMCVNSACVLGACLPGFGDCDNDPSNGCEANLKSATSNCGLCGNACKLPNAVNVCTNGSCSISACLDPYADCNGMLSDGCETNTATDIVNCAACGTVCNSQNGVASCTAKVCGITCNQGYANCDGQLSNGCEINTNLDVNNCNTCGNVCPAPSGTPKCVLGVCGIANCAPDMGDCDGNVNNGCETNLTSSVSNCKTCGNSCSVANGTAACVASTCSVATCNADWENCNGLYSDGCETNLKTTANCGGCGVSCSLANATSSCATGACQVQSCNAGWGNCDGLSVNGCEINTDTSVTNCGTCAKVCNNTNGTAGCASGVCSITCASGWGNCDSNPDNGCETATTNNTDACGTCGKVCAVANGTPACIGTSCAIQGCTSPWKDCNNQYTDGCEINTSNNLANCGACGNACSGTNGAASCTSGVCGIACNPGYGNCDGNVANGCESNLNTDVAHCGSCPNACSFANASSVCSSGICQLGSCNPGYANCDGNMANGCEVSLSTTSNCGSCGIVCSNANGSTACTGGLCVPACASGWGNCDGNVNNGCETSLKTLTDCSACGTVCSYPNAAASCATGSCVLGTCNSGWGNCDGQLANGCETNTGSSINHCGTCTTVCSSVNGTPSCSGGVCAISCSTGFGDCDGNVGTGCETNLTNNLSHCGTCSKVCSFDHAAASCSAGVCELGACAAGWGNCDGIKPNGCETPLNTVADCGGCGQPCSVANATSTCASGTCAISSCNAGFGNCDGQTANGCEANTTTSVTNCGACGIVCNSTNGTPSCTAGVCSIACSSGWGDCDGKVSTGCETSLTNTSNCGTCGAVCTNANGTTSCSTGVCVPSCSAGFASCDGNPSNGCETNVQTSTSHCGTCGTVCANPNGTTSCLNGLCAPVCSAGWGSCDGNLTNGCETNLLGTLGHCGACGTACLNDHGTTVCSSGACVPTCSVGWGNCDANPVNGCETDTKTNTSHCGTCGYACPCPGGSPACNNGVCSCASCQTGWGDCNGNPGDGCESQLNTLTNCGACGTPCARANATATCASGACLIASCNAGYGNCDGVDSNGCETNLQMNLSNCGTCGHACSTTNGSASCSLGVCAIACNAGWGNCDGVIGNGCEAQLNTILNCGACGTACTNANGTTSCSGGACVPICGAGYANCDGNPNNGCETNLQTSTNNCGACGTACANPNGTTSCVSGVCSPVCSTGWGNCDGNPNNGCETSTSSSLSNCGSCGATCTNANGTTVCTSGACVPTCSTGWGNCDGNLNNGCETNTQTNVSNCGSCGTVCNSNNGSASCSLGTCSISCNAGWGNCDGLLSNGCELQLNTISACGSCTNACTNGHGTTSCVSGACAPVCSTGWGNCDGNPSNGCETSLTSLTNCGACGVGCTLANATSSCTTGSCLISSCNTNWGNCDTLQSNGCETATNTTSNCGACGVTCTNPNGPTSCTGGACVPTCNAGYGNCDGNANNGCETNLNTDVSRCGSCTNVCSFANAAASCVGGACQLGACNAGWGNCDGNNANGCETPLDTVSNCGACNSTCTNAHGTTVCTSGACVPACATLWGNCDGNPSNGCETSLTTTSNCSACGTTCSRANATATCSSGTCAISSCNAGFGNCDLLDSNGCEANLQSTLNNCGSCGTVCSSSNGTPSCALGSCSIVCNANWGNCDGNAQTNGCESNLLTDPNHCGNCTTVCSGSTPNCVNGICAASTQVHQNGLGQTYTDPSPLGQPGVCGTYTQQMAIAAASASTIGGSLLSGNCDFGGGVVYNCIGNQSPKQCALWCYQGASECTLVGRVKHYTLNKTCFCPSISDPSWD
jgi:hypothetical protein